MPKLDQCLDPPFTMIPPPGHALVEIVTVERTRKGILLLEAKGEGQPIAKVVKVGPPRKEIDGSWVEYGVQEGDYVLVGPHAPMMKVMDDYAMCNLDAVICIAVGGESDRGHVYHEPEQPEGPTADPYPDNTLEVEPQEHGDKGPGIIVN